jgi:hypothetical protein
MTAPPTPAPTPAPELAAIQDSPKKGFRTGLLLLIFAAAIALCGGLFYWTKIRTNVVESAPSAPSTSVQIAQPTPIPETPVSAPATAPVAVPAAPVLPPPQPVPAAQPKQAPAATPVAPKPVSTPIARPVAPPLTPAPAPAYEPKKQAPPVEPTPRTTAPPPPAPPVAPAPKNDWHTQLKSEMGRCGGNFFEREICKQKIIWQYCAPNDAWGKVPECVETKKPTTQY